MINGTGLAAMTVVVEEAAVEDRIESLGERSKEYGCSVTQYKEKRV